MDNQPVQNPTSEPTLPPVQVPEPKTRFPVIPVLLVILVLLLGSTAFLYYQNMQLKNMLANYQTPVVSPTPSATADPTANWKTYKNAKFRIEFKYPTQWILINNEYSLISPSFDTGIKSQTRQGNQPENQIINYVFDFSKDTIENYGDWKSYDSTKNLGIQKINSLIFEKYILADMYLSLNYIYKTTDNNIYRFGIFPYEQTGFPSTLIDTFDQILSTFKFTK